MGIQFPRLKHFFPAIEPPVELVYVETPDGDEKAIERADRGIRQASKWPKDCGKLNKVLRLKGERPAEIIAAAAGEASAIFVGASLSHDVYWRILGSLSIRVLVRTNSSVLVAKALPEDE
jgi:nucleotide-binding universal stress UspA family protein